MSIRPAGIKLVPEVNIMQFSGGFERYFKVFRAVFSSRSGICYSRDLMLKCIVKSKQYVYENVTALSTGKAQQKPDFRDKQPIHGGFTPAHLTKWQSVIQPPIVEISVHRSQACCPSIKQWLSYWLNVVPSHRITKSKIRLLGALCTGITDLGWDFPVVLLVLGHSWLFGNGLTETGAVFGHKALARTCTTSI